jgi:hypothetical protein
MHQRRLTRTYRRRCGQQQGSKSRWKDAPQVDMKCHGIQPGFDPQYRKTSSVTAAYSVLSSFEILFCRKYCGTR